MSITQQPGRPIVAGYVWRIDVRVTSGVTPVFPLGVVLVSQLRRVVTDTAAIGTLRTADGTITRLDNDTIELKVPADMSAGWPTGSVTLDCVRTDGAEPQYLGFRLRVPVVQPVTRSLV